MFSSILLKFLPTQKRHPNKQNFPNVYDISSAGHIAAGQTSEDAARREVEEELGLIIPITREHLKLQAKVQHVLNNGTYINNEHVDVYLVIQDVDVNKLVLQESEVVEAKLEDLEEYYKHAVIEKNQNYVPFSEESYIEMFDIVRHQLNKK